MKNQLDLKNILNMLIVNELPSGKCQKFKIYYKL